MPVRYEDQPGPIRSENNEAYRETEPSTAGAKRSGGVGRWFLGGLFVVLLVAVVIGALNVRAQRNEAEPTPTASAGPVELPRGKAAEGEGATDNLVGAPVGFPRTADGAASAALTWQNSISAAYFQPAAVRERLAARLYTREAQQLDPLGDKVATQVQDGLHVDATGHGIEQPILHAYSKCLTQYGAYRVDDASSAESKPTEVTVTTWAPCLTGLGATGALDDVDVIWTEQSWTLTWSGKDWQISGGKQATQTPPAPDKPGEPWVSFTERARLLGAGWQVTADATDKEDASVYDEGWVQ